MWTQPVGNALDGWSGRRKVERLGKGKLGVGGHVDGPMQQGTAGEDLCLLLSSIRELGEQEKH